MDHVMTTCVGLE